MSQLERKTARFLLDRTESWIAAEREAREAYKRGELKRFKSVREMVDYIEAGIEADHIYLRNIGGHEILP